MAPAAPTALEVSRAGATEAFNVLSTHVVDRYLGKGD